MILPLNFPNDEWLIAVRQVDHNTCPGFPNMHVGRAVLPRRQKDADLKTVNVEYGGHVTITYRLGYCYDATPS
jgi:hypothetical protein